MSKLPTAATSHVLLLSYWSVCHFIPFRPSVSAENRLILPKAQRAQGSIARQPWSWLGGDRLLARDYVWLAFWPQKRAPNSKATSVTCAQYAIHKAQRRRWDELKATPPYWRYMLNANKEWVKIWQFLRYSRIQHFDRYTSYNNYTHDRLQGNT